MKKALLEYCGQDTLALVKLVGRLQVASIYPPGIGGFDRPSPTGITPPSAPAAPPLPEPFWFLPGCLLLARMKCERLACHLGFSNAHESRGGRPPSSEASYEDTAPAFAAPPKASETNT